jgi:hypothetical protein
MVRSLEKIIYLFICITGVLIQNLAVAKQVLYHLSHVPSSSLDKSELACGAKEFGK